MHDRPIVNPYRNAEGGGSEVKSPCNHISARFVIVVALVLLSTLSYVFHVTHPSVLHETPKKLRGSKIDDIRRGAVPDEPFVSLTPEQIAASLKEQKERIDASKEASDPSHKLKDHQKEMNEHKESVDMHKEGDGEGTDHESTNTHKKPVVFSPIELPRLTTTPTIKPTFQPTARPTVAPTTSPTVAPTVTPTSPPSVSASKAKLTVEISSSTPDKSLKTSVESSSETGSSAFVIDIAKTQSDALLDKLVDKELDPNAAATVEVPEPVELPHPEGGDIVHQPVAKIAPPAAEPDTVAEPKELPHPDGGDIVHESPGDKIAPLSPPLDTSVGQLPNLQVPETEGAVKVEKLSLPLSAAELDASHAAAEQKAKETADQLNAILNTPEQHTVELPAKTSVAAGATAMASEKPVSAVPAKPEGRKKSGIVPPAAPFKIPPAIARAAAESVVTTNGSAVTVKRAHSIYDLEEIKVRSTTTTPPVVLAGGASAAPIDYCKGTTDPFKDQPVETFQPPASAPFEKVNEWQDIVEDMVKGISKINVGGDSLRQKIRSEIRRLQGVRFKMFCMYIQ